MMYEEVAQSEDGADLEGGPSPPRPDKSYREAPEQRWAPCGVARCLGSFMVAVVFGIVALSWVPMVHHYGDGSLSGTTVLLVFHVLVGFLLASYLQTVFTDPGTVPLEWHEAVSRLSNPPYIKCLKSGLYKPPRSHFDSVTRRLVLNMDHYCPWVNNCVGYFNRKFFIQFLGYTALTASYAALCLGYVLWTVGMLDGRSRKRLGDVPRSPARSEELANEASVAVMTMMGALIDGVFGVALVIFCGAHLWMASRNQTTLEGTNYSRPYRLSARRNLEQVFGTDRLYWFLPLYGKGPAGDGIHWQCSDGSWAGLICEASEYSEVAFDPLFDRSKISGARGATGVEAPAPALDCPAVASSPTLPSPAALGSPLPSPHDSDKARKAE